MRPPVEELRLSPTKLLAVGGGTRHTLLDCALINVMGGTPYDGVRTLAAMLLRHEYIQEADYTSCTFSVVRYYLCMRAEIELPSGNGYCHVR